MRSLLAIVIGVIVSVAAGAAIGVLIDLLFPAPVRMRGFSSEAAAAALAQLPMGLKIGIVLSWFGGALIGASIAKRISGRAWAAWTTTGLFAVYILLTVLLLPLPGWMQAIAVIAPLIGGLIANHLVADRAPVAAVEAPPADL